MKKVMDLSKMLLCGALGLSVPAGTSMAQDSLPFAPTPSGSVAGRTMQESTYNPLPKKSHLPSDAPNILIILIDDAGPGTPDAYGGEVHTPNLSQIANQGISYGAFHSTAMSSPTRSALLTGRNHTRVGNGQISEISNDWDGFTGLIPKTSATTAEVLKNYGYSTAAFGKWHLTPATECSKAGPFDNWPTGFGFEYFYGFLGEKPLSMSLSWSRTQPMSIRPKHQSKGIISRKTWRTMPSNGSMIIRPWRRTNRFTCTGLRARFMDHTMYPRNGRISIKVNSTTDGTLIVSGFINECSSKELYLRTPS